MHNEFEKEVQENISRLGKTPELFQQSLEWMMAAGEVGRYSYNFSWFGRPIIQYPQDIMALQELIWSVKPDLIIETGIAHGGSLIFSASMLTLLDVCQAIETGQIFDPKKSYRKVIGIDIDIRPHNRASIEAHPLNCNITMIQGSSIAQDVIDQVHCIAMAFKTILVILDSNHTHEHVLAELIAYAPLTTKGSYCCVFDTLIEDIPDGLFPDRQWGKGNNPKTAVWEYLKILREQGRKDLSGTPLKFEIDKMIENKLLITVAPDGYLKRV